ncbi:Histidine biosynthesis bifunctional protein hisIE, chloroplastic [Linum grandiflorum]
MAASSFSCVHSASLSSRGRVFIPRSYNSARKSGHLVLASSVKSGKEVSSGSKCFSFSSSFQVKTLLDSVKWDDKGLAVAIAQNVDTGAILMQGFVNRDALATTISSRKATFYSRSRSSLWTKGETSNNFINIHDIFIDCDRDSIIYLGKPVGPTCHTGSETCYYTSVLDSLQTEQAEVNRLASTSLYSLESTISQRKAELGVAETEKPSWTKRLLLGHDLLCSKIREEADELCQTLEKNEDKTRAASEMGDVLYHAMVLLALKDVKMEDVLEILRRRFSQSGIEEKGSRGKHKS